MILLYLLVWYACASVVAASFSKVGCFRKNDIIDLLTYSDESIYQSSLHCEEQCPDAAYIAVIDGSTCYCGNYEISLSDEADSSNCDTHCNGYGSENCGGQNYFLVYSQDGVDASSYPSSSSSSSASSSSSSSSSSSDSSDGSDTSSEPSASAEDSSSSDQSTSTEDDSSSSADASVTDSDSASASITESVTTESNSSGVSEITVTRTRGSDATSSTESEQSHSSEAGSNDDDEGGGGGLSGGAIAGIVVGSVAGVGLLAAGALFFLWYKRKHGDDQDDEDGFDLSPPANEKYNVNPNPFVGPAVGKNGTVNSRHTKNPSNNTGSYTSNDEYYMFNAHPGGYDQGGNTNVNGFEPPYPTEDFGRRRLSDGSLPDMAAKSSLKVVNN